MKDKRKRLGGLDTLAKSYRNRIISTTGLFAGILMVLSGCGSNSPSKSTTSIPTFSPESIKTEDITNYASAVIAIESKRPEIYSQIQSVSKKQQVSDINCTKPETISRLSGDVQKIAVDYCNQAKQYIESYKLTITQFNQITATAQVNPNLEQRIQTELIRLNQK